MKRLLLIIIGIYVLIASPALGESITVTLPQTPVMCAGTPFTDQEQCLKCHTIPSFKLKEASADEGYIYPNKNTSIIQENGEIAGYFLMEFILAEDLKQYLNYLDKHKITKAIIEIHSPGGSLLDAWRVIGFMTEWQNEAEAKTIETRVYGFAASAGFLVFMGGKTRLISETAEAMWHELWTIEWTKIATPAGKEDEAKVMRHLQDTCNNYIADRCGLTKEELDEKVRKKEFWVNGKQALEYGFATGLLK